MQKLKLHRYWRERDKIEYINSSYSLYTIKSSLYTNLMEWKMNTTQMRKLIFEQLYK